MISAAIVVQPSSKTIVNKKHSWEEPIIHSYAEDQVKNDDKKIIYAHIGSKYQPGASFINTLRAAFALIFLCPKNYKAKV